MANGAGGRDRNEELRILDKGKWKAGHVVRDLMRPTFIKLRSKKTKRKEQKKSFVLVV
jgi:hypothetical protein